VVVETNLSLPIMCWRIKTVKLAVVEAKSDECEVVEGVQQAKDYAEN